MSRVQDDSLTRRDALRLAGLASLGLGLQNVLDRLALLYPDYSADDLLSCRTRRSTATEDSPDAHRWHVQIRLPLPPSSIDIHQDVSEG